jgi:hypothetical protein
MNSLVKLSLPKTKADLSRAIAGPEVKSIRIELMSGGKASEAFNRAVSQWQREGSRVILVALEI